MSQLLNYSSLFFFFSLSLSLKTQHVGMYKSPVVQSEVRSFHSMDSKLFVLLRPVTDVQDTGTTAIPSLIYSHESWVNYQWSFHLFFPQQL
jgi:hypothetical protein